MRRRAIKNRLCGFFLVGEGGGICTCYIYIQSASYVYAGNREKEWDADGSTGLDVQRETPGLDGLIDIPNTAFLFLWLVGFFFLRWFVLSFSFRWLLSDLIPYSSLVRSRLHGKLGPSWGRETLKTFH